MSLCFVIVKDTFILLFMLPGQLKGVFQPIKPPCCFLGELYPTTCWDKPVTLHQLSGFWQADTMKTTSAVRISLVKKGD